MNKILTVINLILIGLLVYILIYPQMQARKTVEATVVYQLDVGALPLFVAEKYGFFDSTNVKVETKEALFGIEGIEDVAKGKAQVLVGINWLNALFKMAARPEAYRVLYSASYGADHPYTALLTLRKKRIRKLKQLQLKKVGFLRGSRMDFFLKTFLKKEGVDPDKISFVGLLPSEMDSALEKNLVDALLAPEPYRSLLLDRKGIRILEDGFLLKRIVSPLPISLGVTSIVNLNLNKAKVQRVYQALEMALRFIRDYPDSAAQIFRQRFELPDSAVVNLPRFSTYQELEPARLQKVVEACKEAQILLVDIDPSQLILQPSEIK